MKNILTLTLLSSLLCVGVYADCVRNSNETVTCDKSKLMWQDNKNHEAVEKTWENAIKYCEDLNFAGYSDWRLPNINELLSIVDRSKYDPAINGAFKNINLNDYLSSSSFPNNIYNVWIVDFSVGSINRGYKSHSNSVRCVRAGE